MTTLKRDSDATLARTQPEGATTLRPTILSETRAVPAPGTSDATLTQDAIPVPQRSALGPGAQLVAGYALRGRYLLQTLIGQGAMGQVWRAQDLLSAEARDRNPFVALKVLTADVDSQPDAFIALHREAARAQKLAHPNVITVQQFDRDDQIQRAFIVMELLQGQPLDRIIREGPPGGLPREKAMPIIRGMAEGLAYAHRTGLVHSDFKPANVFLTKEGVPKILDFGIARAVNSLDATLRQSAALDESGFQGYTKTYAAPEVLAGTNEAHPADDVFALGLVAYELLTGRHPFDRQDALTAEHERMQLPALRGVTGREARALQRALSFDRARRQADAGVFLRELQGIPLIQKVLVGVVGLLIVAAASLGYLRHLDSLPAQPLSQLPLEVQQSFHEKIKLGSDSLAYLERTHDITASADAAQYFADAYALHPKDPEAVAGLNKAADIAIEWYNRMSDREQAREELLKFRKRSDYYKSYAPLVRAIRSAGGD